MLALVAATASWASSEAGYSIELTPAAAIGQAWLLALATERSQPNPARADATPVAQAPQQRRQWLLFDTRARLRCAISARATDDLQDWPDVSERMQSRCRALAGADSKSWAKVTLPSSDPGVSWTADQACRGQLCATYTVPIAAVQTTLGGRQSLSPTPGAPARPAPARCIAGRWLIVTNVQDLSQTGALTGALFRGLPPPVPADIVGYEFARVDGVARVPDAFACQ